MKKRYSVGILVLLALALMLTVGATSVAADCVIKSRVSMTVHCHGCPDSGFYVAIKDCQGTVVASGYTDEDGEFDRSLCPGEYTYTITKQCYQNLTGSISLRFLDHDWIDRDAVAGDNSTPTISAPANVTVPANAQCKATGVNLGTPTVADTCVGSSSLTVWNDAPSSFPLGVTTVTWYVKDPANNQASATQKVTVVDQTRPTISAPADVTVGTNSGCAAINVPLGTPATADNCHVKSVTNNAPASFPLGVTTVTWTVADDAGNTATATQKVTVADRTRPTISAPADVTVPVVSGCSVGNVSLGNPTTADNCHVKSVTNDAPATYPLGTTNVTWTVADDAGNTATATQKVIVVDRIDPTISAPADVTAATNSGCTAINVALGSPTTADNCHVKSVTNNAPATYPLGTTNVVWTVTDDAGNTSTATQKVIVVDQTDPTISAPVDVTAATNSGCTATNVALGSPVTGDNCSVKSTTNNAPAAFPLGTTTVTWTVTDGSGNTATATQKVTVLDQTDPTISAPADVTAGTNSGCAATNVALGTPVTGDNCSVKSVTNNAPASFPLGMTTVTWTVTDGAGNTATATQKVTVVDQTKPTVTCPKDITAPADASCTATVDLGQLIASDNCGVKSITNDAPARFALGTTTVTWTVTDNAGNETLCKQRVTVADSTVPVVTISAPGNGAYVHETVEIKGSVADPQQVTIDVKVNGAVVAHALPYSWDTTKVGDGSYTIEVIARDCAQNQGSASVTVIVDNTAPVPPVITGSQSPALGAGGQQPLLSLIGVDEDNARIQIWARLPGAADFTFLGSTVADACGRWTWQGPISEPGAYVIRAGAKDIAGNWSGWSDTFTMNVSPSENIEVLALQQDVDGYTGTTDATLAADAPAANYGNAGTLNVRQSDGKAALVRFDLSQVPAGMTVKRAVLAVYVGERTNGSPLNLSAFSMLASWDEMQATWKIARAGTPWAAAGANGAADRAGSALATSTVSLDKGWVTLDITSEAARWLSDPAANNGLVLKGSGSAAVEYAFRSSEWWEVCRRPRLMLTLGS